MPVKRLFRLFPALRPASRIKYMTIFIAIFAENIYI